MSASASGHQSCGTGAFMLPAPVFVVGAYDGAGRPALMTAAWGGVCCSQPPCLSVSLRRTSWTRAALLARQAFTLNLPDCSMVAAVDFIGLHSGADTDKCAELGLAVLPGEHVNAPCVPACPVIMELTLRQSLELGSHTLCIGEIMDVRVAQASLDAQGRPDVHSLDPLVFLPLLQEYWSMGTFAAKAFSVGHAVQRAAKVELVVG